MNFKAEYIEHCASRNELPLFHQPYWWDVAVGQWQVEKFEVENAAAYFPYASYRKWGFTFSRNPFLTPYSGLLFIARDYSTLQKQKLFDLASQFLAQFSISQYDSHPLLAKDISSATKKQTFLLPLNKSADALLQKFKPSLRRQLRKAASNLIISTANDTDALYTFYRDSLNRQSGKEIVSEEIVKAVYKLCQRKECGHVFIAKDHEQNLHAAIWYVADKKCGYYLLGGSDSDFLGSGAMGYLLWHCIRYAKKNNLAYFDFEGSEVPGVARFFSTFGGERIEYPILSAPTDAKLSLLLKVKAKLGR